MGLLDRIVGKNKAKLRSPKKNLKGKSNSKGINKRLLRKHHTDQIKKEEAKVKEHKHAISAETGKLQVKRPEGSSKILKKNKKSELNLKSAKGKDSLVSAERAHTGIPGLDDVMEGGFRRNTVNMVGGGAGCGKSIFCMQYLVEGIKQHGENGVYISFEESEEDILKDFSRFGWDLKDLIKKDKLAILYYSPEQVEKVLKVGGGAVLDLIRNMKTKRIVLDSLTAFTLLQVNDLQKRRQVLKLIEAIKKWNVTALMTSEQEPDPDKHTSTIIEFEVEGVILLYNIRKGDSRERSLEVFKMRGTKHSAKIFPMKIDDSGIVIYPEETVF
jgi:circadian clock protein KaiC